MKNLTFRIRSRFGDFSTHFVDDPDLEKIFQDDLMYLGDEQAVRPDFSQRKIALINYLNWRIEIDITGKISLISPDNNEPVVYLANIPINDLIDILKIFVLCYMEKVQDLGWQTKLCPEPKYYYVYHTRPDIQLIHKAAMCGDVDGIKIMFKDSPSCLHVTDRFGSTPLHLAVLAEQAESCEILLELGADKYAKSTKGKTPYDFFKKFIKESVSYEFATKSERERIIKAFETE